MVNEVTSNRCFNGRVVKEFALRYKPAYLRRFESHSRQFFKHSPFVCNGFIRYGFRFIYMCDFPQFKRHCSIVVTRGDNDAEVRVPLPTWGI